MFEGVPVLQMLVMPVMMISICAMNLIVTHRRAENRSSLDARRLQAALVEELQLLAKLYRSNLDLLDRPELRLISTRIPLAIFRGNVGRITLLDEDVIRPVVSVHANNEHLETMVSERAKTIKNGQCTVYVFDKDDGASVEHFRSPFGEGLALVENAVRYLETKQAISAAPAPMWQPAETKALLGTIGRSLGLVDV